jgi:hypothetical protein
MSIVPASEAYVVFAVIGFGVALAACLVGLFYKGYEENWLQHLGMLALSIGCLLKIIQVLGRGRVTFETTLLAIGIGLFATGVVWKVLKHRHDTAPPARRKRFTSLGH